MKPKTETKIVEFLGTTYQITYHHGSNVVEFDELVLKRFDKFVWKRIFMGHTTMLEEVIKYAEEKRSEV